VPVWRFAFSARETVPPAVKEGGGELDFGESRKFRAACVEPKLDGRAEAPPHVMPEVQEVQWEGRPSAPPIQV